MAATRDPTDLLGHPDLNLEGIIGYPLIFSFKDRKVRGTGTYRCYIRQNAMCTKPNR